MNQLLGDHTKENACISLVISVYKASHVLIYYRRILLIAPLVHHKGLCYRIKKINA